MAKAVKETEDKQEIKREDLMKKPGWSNTPPDSPAAKPAKTRIIPEEQINHVSE